ncbi:hypothetical protein [Magnetospira thiophila]
MPPPTPVSPLGGRLDVLGPSMMFDPGAPPPGWMLLGDRVTARQGLAVTRILGVPALQMTAGNSFPYALIRPVDASLLATPFLDWFRYHDNPVTGEPQPQLILGFWGGVVPPLTMTAALPGLPSHDRWLTLDWPGTRPGDAAWVRESADVSRLYAERWPQDDLSQVRVRFIGLLSHPDRGGSPTLALSGLTLTR